LKILITGATGFVGRYLILALIEDARAGTEAGGFEVFGTTYPQPPGLSDRNIVHIDLRAEGELFRLVRDVRPDWVFHLAAVSNVRNSWQIRRETLETNIVGTQNLLESVRLAAPGARVLFISSSDVYGLVGSAEKQLTEEDPVQIINPYAYSKAAGEMMCEFYVKVEGLDIVTVRQFPHTGPGQTADFVYPDWARQIVQIERGESEPVIRVGNLEVKRDFSDVRDVVKAYILLMNKGRRGEVYNVCSGKALALREILGFLVGEAETASSRLPECPGNKAGRKQAIRIQVDPDKLRKTDVPLLLGSNRKLVAETGWSPRIPIEQTLRDLLAYWREK
jgi:GDP-4-dehydro-6-deoxy-D-mannose reductase